MARITTVAELIPRPGDFVYIPQSGWAAEFAYSSAGPSDPVSATLLAKCTSHAWMRNMFTGACPQQASVTAAGGAVSALAIPRTALFAELLKLAVSFGAPSFDLASVTPAQNVLFNPRLDMDGNRMEGAVWGGTYRMVRARYGGCVTLDISWAPYKVSITIDL
jgi:hypothetical protein